MIFTRRLLLGATAAVAAAPSAFAQAWPAKPIRIIVPFPAGQATDAVPQAELVALAEAHFR